MKQSKLRWASLLLALACIAGLALSGLNARQALACKDYWEKSGVEAEASFQLLEDGIELLKENESVYLEGAQAYEAGQREYEEGQTALADGGAQLQSGQAAYDEGAAKLAEGHTAYDEGKAKLEEGKKAYQEGLAQLEAAKTQLEQGKAELEQGKAELEAGKQRLAAGEAELEAHRQEYEEGKAKLEQVEPIYQAALQAKAMVDELQARYDEAAARGDAKEMLTTGLELAAAQQLLQTELRGYSIEGIIAEVEDGKAKIAAYEAGQAEVEAGRQAVAEGEAKIAAGEAKIAEGEAQIAAGEAKLAAAKKQLDEGEARLAAAKRQLDDGEAALADAAGRLGAGYADYAAGKERLAVGAEALADGLSRLGEYVGGEQQLAEGLNLVLGTDTYYNAAGEPLVPAIASRLTPEFSYWKLDEDGNYLFVNGERNLDLEKATMVLNAGRGFLTDTNLVVTDELTSRFEVLLVAAAAAVLGLVGALLGFRGKRRGAMIPAVLAAAAAGAAVALMLVSGTENPLSVVAGTGGTQTVLLASAAVILFSLTEIAAAAAQRSAPKAN